MPKGEAAAALGTRFTDGLLTTGGTASAGGTASDGVEETASAGGTTSIYLWEFKG